MWGLFSRDPLKDFAYEIGDLQPGVKREFSLWDLHFGKKKGSREDCSIFVATASSEGDRRFLAAKLGYKSLKKLRHPNILAFQDGIETDKSLYVVTDPVQPLAEYISTAQLSEAQISWGIFEVASAVNFLNKDCQQVHCAVNIWSIFVTRGGEWKLGCVDFVAPTSGDIRSPKDSLTSLQRYWPLQQDFVSNEGEKIAIDPFGLGCLLWEAFNGPLDEKASLKNVLKVPKSLLPVFRELTSPKASQRPSVDAFLAQMRSKGGFMDNNFFHNMLFVTEIHLKDGMEKLRFLERLSSNMDQFPVGVRRYKLLPLLISALDMSQEAGPVFLVPLLKLGRLLDQTEYQQKVVPGIVKLFASPDRQTRVRLLSQLDDYVDCLSVQTINEQIFLPLCQGFIDVNPVVREASVKSIASIAPKLNSKNLNEEILRHFSRMQTRDEQPSVRVNTTVCIGKIAPSLSVSTRQRVLAPLLARSLRDPFSPARQASILALVATAQFYTLAETANRVVPSLCPCLVDPDVTVREQAFRAIGGFIEKLEKASKNPEIIPELEKHVNTTCSVAGSSLTESASSWAGWAASAMTNLLTTVRKQEQQQKPAQQPQSGATSAAASGSQSEVSGEQRATPHQQAPRISSPPDAAPAAALESGSGWDDNFDDAILEPVKVSSTLTSSKAPASGGGAAWETSAGGNDWDNDNDADWLSPIDDLPAPIKPSVTPASTSASARSAAAAAPRPQTSHTLPVSQSNNNSPASSTVGSFGNASPRITSTAAENSSGEIWPDMSSVSSRSASAKAGPLKLGAKKLTFEK